MTQTGIETRKSLLFVESVKKYYPIRKKAFSKKPVEFIKAVDGVSFKIYEGEMLGLVGESGCGKSTIARLIVRLEDVSEGRIWFNGQNIGTLKGVEMQEARKNFQIVFQDPYSSLNPRQRIGDILGEALSVHGLKEKQERWKRILELLDLVGIPANATDRFPHEFSGGQRQRIGIARALSVNPRLLICDEPVSALDVSIQVQVLNLLKDLQKELNLTVLFIAHGLGAVKYISDRIIVMNKGVIVEEGRTTDIFSHPQDPYTQKLLKAYPVPDPLKRSRRKKIPVMA